MDELIAVIEGQLPQLKWLVRSTDEGADRERIGGKYFAHLYASALVFTDDAESYQGFGNTPWEALNGAYCKAARK